MLNELVTISAAMDEAGIAHVAGHAQIKRLGRGTAWRIRLGTAGKVAGVDFIAPDVFSRLWTMRDGQHNSFPFAKLPSLFDPTDAGPVPSGKTATVTERMLWLNQFRGRDDVSAEWPTRCFSKGLMSSNVNRRRRLSATKAEAVVVLIDRFNAVAKDAQGFGLGIAEAILEEVDASGSKDLIDGAIAAFSSDCNYYFDLSVGSFPIDVGDPRTEALLSAALAGGGEGARGICVLSGAEASLHDGPFPQPKLPVLGQTYLFSRNGNIPAAARYGRSAAMSFPAGQALIGKLSGALERLTDADARGETWIPIPGEKPKQFDLFLSYVNAVGHFPIASTLTSDAAPTDDTESAVESGEAVQKPADAASFKKRASNLIQSFKASSQVDLVKTRVGFCIIRAVDPANRKVIYQTNVAVADLQYALEEWIVAGNNLPDYLRLPVPSKTGEGWARLIPKTIDPLKDITNLTKGAFVNGGSRRVKVVGILQSDSLALFLFRDKALATRILTMLLARGGQLLEGIRHAERRQPSALKDFEHWSALKHASALAITLHFLGRTKGQYMEDLAYKIGQFLNAVDIIHVGYCLEERSGQIPATLLGNSFFRMAQSDPVGALGALAQRWSPYNTWMGKTSSKMREALQHEDKAAEKAPKLSPEQRSLRSAYYTKQRLRDLCRELHEALKTCSKDPTPAFRAELLLGYLAGLEVKARGEKTDDEPADNQGANT